MSSRDERACRPQAHVVRCPRLQRAAAVDDADAVGERLRLLEIVGDEDDRDCERAPQARQLFFQGLARHAVDGRERLIEQQHFGIAGKRAGKRHALALAARELIGLARLEAVEVHPRQQRYGLRRALGLGDVAHGEPHVVERREMRKERVILEHEPDGARLWRHHDAEGAVEPDIGARNNAAGGRPVEPRDGVQNRRLARA